MQPFNTLTPEHTGWMQPFNTLTSEHIGGHLQDDSLEFVLFGESKPLCFDLIIIEVCFQASNW